MKMTNVLERLIILSDSKITENEVLTYGVANPTRDPFEAVFNKYDKLATCPTNSPR